MPLDFVKRMIELEQFDFEILNHLDFFKFKLLIWIISHQQKYHALSFKRKGCLNPFLEAHLGFTVKYLNQEFQYILRNKTMIEVT
uniref:Uncharacterized protein n=1 Tax=Panagrolaimus sp. PS1159 TaxID=55785 RepID=A0AC35G3Y7_9BILA